MTERSPWPSEEELHQARMEHLLLSLHDGIPGRVQRYDAAHQVADIVPQVRNPHPQPDGSYAFESLPVLPDVPLLFPRVGQWFMAMSVEPGDAVLIVCGSVAPGRWRRATTTDALTGIDRAVQGVTDPDTLVRFHLQNAYALVGLETYGRPLAHAPPLSNDPDACLRLGHDADAGLRLSLYQDGRFELTKGASTLVGVGTDGVVHVGGAAGEFVALAAATDAIVTSLKTLINGWMPTGTGDGVSLKALIAGWSPDSTAATKVKAT